MGFRVRGVNVIRLFVDAEGEQVGFESGHAIEAPGCVGDGLHELVFERALGLEVVEEAAGVVLVGGVVFGGKDDDVAGESMAEGVEGGCLPAAEPGAGGVRGVGAIDVGASIVRGSIVSGFVVVGSAGSFGCAVVIGCYGIGHCDLFLLSE